MKYVFTFIWSFLLSHMVTYVVGSIFGATYNFDTGNVLAVGLFILVLFVPLILPKDEQLAEK
ncbi:YjzD family protein [Fervidibacillus albus]|uniref:YjzD family protein n=1 Tax=Fervidibacillus albus TaxID=2980026 RepID=A0A9E8LSA0_9BACI|nr:YjzD family protein [Fervidibacillus albus]WAA08665.1 YjzD family protein [Fervidibacillus albus]